MHHRLVNAHGAGRRGLPLPEQEALEYLAALSVLARWVDVCKPEPKMVAPTASEQT